MSLKQYKGWLLKNGGREVKSCDPIPYSHRRMIKTEEKAKVVASVWGTEFIQFLAMLTILH